MKDEADALLADLELKGVLGRLECDETTETLFHGYFVPKPGGKRVQLVTDYTPINPYIERPVHPFPSPDIVFQSVGKDSKWFAKLDALHGYYQIPLAPESQKLTAFLLPHRHPERDGVRESRAPGMTKKSLTVCTTAFVLQRKRQISISIRKMLSNVISVSQMGGSSSNTEEKEEEPTMDTSTQMTENLSGFHILEIHMPSMGTGRRLLLLVGAAVLALRWWVQRRHAKKMWLKGGFHSQAYEMGCRCQPCHPYFPPAGPFWMHGGDETGGRFEELPSGAAGPPFSRPPRHSGRGLAPPSPPGEEDDVEGGPALGRR